MESKKTAPVKSQQKNLVFVDKIYAKYEDVISWEARDSDISIFIPEASVIFGSSERVFDVPKGSNLELTVVEKLSVGEQKSYFYAIYDKNTRIFAESNSDPEIIIMG